MISNCFLVLSIPFFSIVVPLALFTVTGAFA